MSTIDRIPAWVRVGRFDAPVGFGVGVATSAAGVLGLVSAAIGLATDGRDVGRFAASGSAMAVVGALLVVACSVPRRLRSSTAFVGVVAVWITLIGLSTLTYLGLDTFRGWDDALFESVAGFTTTASTVLADPEAQSRATLFWRAGTQWLGGLAGLLFVVAVLPSIGVGGLDVTEAGESHSGTSLRSRRTIRQVERLAGLYVGLTVVGIGLYLAAGMGPFDAVTYAATTISTGGFANHAGSFAHFDSALVEWAGVGGMFLGGANMALLFHGLRRTEPGSLWRSYELRAYAAIVVVGGGALALVNAPSTGVDHDTVRSALFHVTSAASTTGHHVGGWASWEVGAQVVLLAVAGIGAMSGSAGSGFRLVRALVLVGYLRRELVVQIQPRSVAPVRVGRRIVPEPLVARIIGYQTQYLLVAATGAVVLGSVGVGLVESLSGAVSAVANFGPAMGELAPGQGGVLDQGRVARAVTMPLMLLGRLEIAPVLVGVAIASSTVGRRIAPLFVRRRPGRAV